MNEIYIKHLLTKNYQQDDPTRYLLYDWVDAREEDQLPQLFFQLQQTSLTTKAISCLQFLDCLEEKSPDMAFQKYSAVSEFTEIVFRRTGEPLSAIAENIYKGLYEDRLRLKKQMKQVIFFRLAQLLGAAHFEKIAAQIQERTNIRLENFQRFQQFLSLPAIDRSEYLLKYFNG